LSGVGLWTLFGSSFLASTLLPGGSEAVLVYSHSQGFASSLVLILVAGLGNTLGGLSSWLIGGSLKNRLFRQRLEKPAQKRALHWIGKHGSPVLLLSWLPVIGDPLCLAAGWAGVRLFPAAVFIGIGKVVRYAILLALLPPGDPEFPWSLH
jgi:membrane protein YqaA with SNARE-associated domain